MPPCNAVPGQKTAAAAFAQEMPHRRSLLIRRQERRQPVPPVFDRFAARNRHVEAPFTQVDFSDFSLLDTRLSLHSLALSALPSSESLDDIPLPPAHAFLTATGAEPMASEEEQSAQLRGGIIVQRRI